MKQPRLHPASLLLLLACQMSAPAADLADPTRPISVPAQKLAVAKQPPPAAALKLDGIVHSMQREVAIVNGRLIHAGEWLGDARIDTISRDCVRYTRGGRTHVLMLSAPLNVRRSPAAPEEKR